MRPNGWIRLVVLPEEAVIVNYARSLIEASRDPLFTISAEGIITDINLATQKITELSREQIIGTNFIKYFTHYSATSAKPLRPLREKKD